MPQMFELSIADEWINKLWYIIIMEYYSDTKSIKYICYMCYNLEYLQKH